MSVEDRWLSIKARPKHPKLPRAPRRHLSPRPGGTVPHCEASTPGDGSGPRYPRPSTNLADHRSALELVVLACSSRRIGGSTWARQRSWLVRRPANRAPARTPPMPDQPRRRTGSRLRSGGFGNPAPLSETDSRTKERHDLRGPVSCHLPSQVTPTRIPSRSPRRGTRVRVGDWEPHFLSDGLSDPICPPGAIAESAPAVGPGAGDSASPETLYFIFWNDVDSRSRVSSGLTDGVFLTYPPERPECWPFLTPELSGPL